MMGHALFASGDDGADEVEVEWIAVKRFERGSFQTAPRMFAADELPDAEALYEVYGGGSYELEARAGGETGRARWTRKVKIQLPGPSKPLVDVPIDAGGGMSPAPVAMPQTSDPSTGMVAMVLQMAQQNAQMMMAMMGNMSQQQSQTMATFGQMITAMVGSQRNDQAGVVKAIADMSNADKAHLATVLTAVGGGRGNGDLGAFMKGLEFHQKLTEESMPEPEANGESEIIETIGQVMGGFQAFQGGQAAGQVPPGVAPHVPYAPPAAGDK